LDAFGDIRAKWRRRWGRRGRRRSVPPGQHLRAMPI